MGALKGVTAKAPRYAHSWGWAIDTTRRDLFNPLRRDLFLRQVWQKDEEIRAMVTVMEMKWDPESSVCKYEPKYGSLFRGWSADPFRDCWGLASTSFRMAS